MQGYLPDEKYLLVLLGPTGVGKTDLSVKIAERVGSEIISADSRQFYMEMKIGTAVPPSEYLEKIKHHFISFLPLEQYYSASLFERDVLDLLPQLFSKNSIAVMTGGSGMYIDAVCNGIDDIPDVDPHIREKYVNMYREEGIMGLRVALKLLDPEHYSRVDLKNHMRIMRALEISESTGQPYSSFLRKEKQKRPFMVVKIGLQRDREELFERINNRVDAMIAEGLEEEAARLYPMRHLNSLNTVGYKEFFDYFDGITSKEKAVELIKRNTRRYAKRQITWWARDSSIRWFSPEEEDKILTFIAARMGGINR